MIPADNNATVSEEVRELYGNLSKHLAHSKCDCVTVEECYTKRLGLLSDALRKERERVRRETQLDTASRVIEIFRRELTGLLDTMAKELTEERALAAKGASHE